MNIRLRWVTWGFSLLLAHQLHAQPYQLLKVDANPAKGFSWPYYLTVPSSVKTPAVLMVYPNNTGYASDDQSVHDRAARNFIDFWASNSEISKLGSPVLVPTFPRPYADNVAYTQALDRRTLLLKTPGMERIDLQLIAMVEDARARLAAKGVTVGPKFWMAGLSASGQFASRFVMLHPDVIQAASIGSPGFGPIVPVAQWKGKQLPYPEGIADVESLVGKPVDVSTFRLVPLQMYIGDEDFNELPWWKPDSDPEVALIDAVFGGPDEYLRWPKYEMVYNSVGSSSQWVIFPGMGHTYAPMTYYTEFFERNRVAPFPPPLPKPLVQTVYFPHLTCNPPWDTEIALAYTLEGAPVTGQLRAYTANGAAPVTILPVTLGPAGRKEIAACREFPNPQQVAYVSFVSDSGFVAAYARFSPAGGDGASVAAAKGSTRGVFLKLEKQVGTRFGFVNTDTSQATVRLSAYNDAGSELAKIVLVLDPGVKIVGTAETFFGGPLTGATNLRYSSTAKVLAFAISGSADGGTLDGIPIMPEYSAPGGTGQ